VSQGISREAVFAGEQIASFYGRFDEDWLPKISIGIEESNEAFDLNIVQFAGEVGDGIVPANQAVGDYVESSFYLLGDYVAGDFVLNVEEIGVGSFSAIERGNGSAEGLRFGGIAYARVAARARKIEAGSRAHFEQPFRWDDFPGWAARSNGPGEKGNSARQPFVLLGKEGAVTKDRKSARWFGSKFAVRRRRRLLFSASCRIPNPQSSRLESAKQIPRFALLARNADARRIVSPRLETRGSLSSGNEPVLDET